GSISLFILANYIESRRRLRLQFDLIHDEEQVKGRLFTYKLLVYRPYRRKVKEVEELDVL
ncbi:MAG: hypothetical protein ACLVGH_19625, partial [Bacteroides xylanisolvens]